MDDRLTGAQVEAWASKKLDEARADHARAAGNVHDRGELVNQIITLNLEPHRLYRIPTDVEAACPDENTRALVTSLMQRAAAVPEQENPS